MDFEAIDRCKRTKAALIRHDGYPIGSPAPMYLRCDCGYRLDVAHKVNECPLGHRWDERGWRLPDVCAACRPYACAWDCGCPCHTADGK